MPELLTQEWLDVQRVATAELPERPGCSAVIEYQVTGGGDGTTTFHTVMEDGRIAENALGPADDPDFTMVLPLEEFRAVVDGSLDPNVGFMQGRIKVRGDIGRMLSVLPVTCSEEWRQMAETVRAQTQPRPGSA